jgi:peptidoglycan/LPS O-acetylase OafA/YrhL
VFYLRRAFRILPIYLLSLVLYLLTRVALDPSNAGYDWLFADPMPFLSYLTFTQNIFMGIKGSFGPNWLGITWSLAVEEQFYLLIPLLFFHFGRQRAAWVLLLAITAAVLLRTALPGFHAFVNTPWRADSILTGALLAIAVRWEPFLAMIKQQRNALYATFALFLAGAAVMTLRPMRFGELSSTWLAVLYGQFVLIGFVGLDGLAGRALGSRMLGWLGRISFAVYLFHQPINGLMHGLLLDSTPSIQSANDAGVTMLSLLLTLGLATASFRYLEGPLLRFAHGFRYARPTS